MTHSRLIEKISFYTGVSKEKIFLLSENSQNEFRKVTVLKGKKKREVYIPSIEVKLIQSYINLLVFSQFPISSYSHGYVQGRSIKSNVLQHKNSKYFFRTDIKSFFPSISSAHIRTVLLANDSLSSEDLNFILKIVAPFGCLDLGSVTSPKISNIIMYSVDNEIIKCLLDFNSDIVYTRYSDDITISSRSKLDLEILVVIKSVLEREGFHLNSQKTSFSTLKDNIKITGLFLNADGFLSVGTKFKKNLKHYLYLRFVKGESKKSDDELLGMLSFMRDIEPDYYHKLILNFSKDKSIVELLSSTK